jgi:hypothetical protein
MHVGNQQMTNTCNLCHINTGDTPWTFQSGAVGGQGCRGCHGVDNGTQFEWAAGLREHHRASGELRCLDCHTDAPSSILPESTVPVYYTRPEVFITDPCSSQRPEGEDFDNDGEGLDNDGDLAYDESDPDCMQTGIGDNPPGSPPLLALYSIAPNPAFAGGVDVTYGVAQTTDVVLRVYDPAGRYVLEKTFSRVSEGIYTFPFDGKNAAGELLPSGVYVVQVEAGQALATGRFVLIR